MERLYSRQDGRNKQKKNPLWPPALSEFEPSATNELSAAARQSGAGARFSGLFLPSCRYIALARKGKGEKIGVPLFDFGGFTSSG